MLYNLKSYVAVMFFNIWINKLDKFNVFPEIYIHFHNQFCKMALFFSSLKQREVICNN